MVLVVVSSFIWAMILANVFYCLFYLNLQGNWVVPIVQFLSSFSFTQSTQIGGDMCRSPTRDGVASCNTCMRQGSCAEQHCWGGRFSAKMHVAVMDGSSPYIQDPTACGKVSNLSLKVWFSPDIVSRGMGASHVKRKPSLMSCS